MTDFSRAIGPRKVGGRYLSGRQGEKYTVLRIESNRKSWPPWQITVRWDCGGVATLSTAWEPAVDEVIS